MKIEFWAWGYRQIDSRRFVMLVSHAHESVEFSLTLKLPGPAAGVDGSLTVSVAWTLMVGHGGSSAGSYLADPTSPIPFHYAVITLFKSVSVHQLSWLAL